MALPPLSTLALWVLVGAMAGWRAESFLAPRLLHTSNRPLPRHGPGVGSVGLRDSTHPDAVPVPPPYPPGKPPPEDLVECTALSRFLTQRAAQLQLYYLEMNLDETAGTWLAEFLQPKRKDPLSPDYHGIEALPTYDSSKYVGSLLCSPELEILVRKPMGCSAGFGHGGLNSFTGEPITRRSNPYIQPRFFEYTDVIEPFKLGERLLASRAQVAREIATDLDFLREEDEAIISATGLSSNTISCYSTLPQETMDTEGTGGRSSPFRLATYDLVRQLATREALFLALAKLRKVADGAARDWLSDFSKPFLESFNSHNIWSPMGGSPTVTDQFFMALASSDEEVADAGERELRVALARDVVSSRSELVGQWQTELVQVEEEHRRWVEWAKGILALENGGSGAAEAAGDGATGTGPL